MEVGDILYCVNSFMYDNIIDFNHGDTIKVKELDLIGCEVISKGYIIFLDIDDLENFTSQYEWRNLQIDKIFK
jgi:hypothetical protein